MIDWLLTINLHIAKSRSIKFGCNLVSIGGFLMRCCVQALLFCCRWFFWGSVANPEAVENKPNITCLQNERGRGLGALLGVIAPRLTLQKVLVQMSEVRTVPEGYASC